MDHVYLWGWWVLESNRTFITIKLGCQVGVECELLPAFITAVKAYFME